MSLVLKRRRVLKRQEEKNVHFDVWRKLLEVWRKFLVVCRKLLVVWGKLSSLDFEAKLPSLEFEAKKKWISSEKLDSYASAMNGGLIYSHLFTPPTSLISKGSQLLHHRLSGLPMFSFEILPRNPKIYAVWSARVAFPLIAQQWQLPNVFERTGRLKLISQAWLYNNLIAQWDECRLWRGEKFP